jgi:hypothetical protein
LSSVAEATHLEFKAGTNLEAKLFMDIVPPDPNGQQDSSRYLGNHIAAFKVIDFIFESIVMKWVWG